MPQRASLDDALAALVAPRFMRIELCLSFMISGVLLVWYMWLGGQHSVDELLQQNRSPIYGTLASIFGTLLGFIITVTSIVVGFAGSSQLRVVRESQHYSTIWAVFASATRALGLATVLALLALIFDRDTKPIPLLMFALVFAATLSLFRVLRAVDPGKCDRDHLQAETVMQQA